jgi:hypothetical protein
LILIKVKLKWRLITSQVDVLPLPQVGIQAEQQPYYPFPVAVDMGIVQEPAKLAKELDRPPVVDLLNGYLPGRSPQPQRRGIIPTAPTLNNETDAAVFHTAAFDHVAARFRGDYVEIAPTSQKAVTEQGSVRQDGLVVLGRDDGRIRLVSQIASAKEMHINPWRYQEMREQRRVRLVGGRALYLLYELGLPDYDALDISGETGKILAKVYEPKLTVSFAA